MASSGNQWADFLARPGARSSDPEFNPPKKSMAQMFKGLSPDEVKALNDTEKFVGKGSDKPLTSPDALLASITPELPTLHDFKISLPAAPAPARNELSEALMKARNELSEALMKASLAATLGGSGTATTTNAAPSKSLSADDLKEIWAMVEKSKAQVEKSKAQLADSFRESFEQQYQFNPDLGISSSIRPFGKSMLMSTPLRKNDLFGDFTKIKGRTADWIITDEVAQINHVEDEMATTEMSEVSKAALEKLAAEMQKGFESAKPVVTLLAPESLTVLMTSKGYQKAGHIGGEEFVPQSIYLGKKGKLIACFKPREAAAYQHAEMPVDDALVKMAGFAEAAEASCADGYKSRMNDIKKEVTQQRDAERLAEKADVYKDIGFGSW